jgi:hypothetical protein
MKKLVYRYQVTHFLSEEDQHLSDEELKDKYFPYYYDYFRSLKDNGIINGRFTWADSLGMKVEEEEPGEREEIMKIKRGEF